MNKNLEIKPSDYDKPFVVLEGKAPDPINLKGHQINGNISAVADFLLHREPTVNKKTSHIEVDLQAGTIILFIDADSPQLAINVNAKIYRPKHLMEIGINKNDPLTLKEMGDLLRTHRFLFDSLDDYGKVVAALNSFKAKVETEIEAERNTGNGSRRNLVDKKVTVESQKFMVKTPLYVGGAEKKFLVEVCCDVSDGSSIFWLESLDLIELEKEEIGKVLGVEVEKLKDKGLSIIYK